MPAEVTVDDLSAPLPPPGGGDSAARLAALWSFGSRSPTMARVAEAHHDALAIIAESGRTGCADVLHGVWAAGAAEPLRLDRDGSGWRLRGPKHWCSGASFVRRALVTAEDSARGTTALVLVDLCAAGADIEAAAWESPAFPTLDTRTVRFDCVVTDDDIVGVDDWYVSRPGFWHGAIGVAACWAGCAAGIVERLRPAWRNDPHSMAALGAIDARLWSMRAALDAAAAEIDRDPVGTNEVRQARALRVRHVVDDGCDDIERRVMRALGPGPFAHVAEAHRHLIEMQLYRRQCHAERDLETLGRIVAAEP